MTKTVVISTNAAWNIVNFRAGLVRAMLRQGYRVVALAPAARPGMDLSSLGIEHVTIDIDSKGMSPLADLGLTIRFRRALQRIAPDAMLNFTIKPNVYGSIAAHSLGIPVINNVSGLGTAFIREGWLTRIVSMLYRVAFRRSHCVFFQNGDDQHLFVSRGLVAAGRSALLPGSGIDLGRFTAAPTGIAARSFRFLLIARLLRDKGVVEYVEAARLLRRDFPDVEFCLLGYLDVENRTAVTRAEVDQWVDAGLINYLGDTDDVRPAIAAADCIVLPSYREGLPRTLLEGSAMAKPLIATDVPGCRAIARADVNALLCRAKDAGSLAAAMRRMIGLNPAIRRDMGLAGRRIVEAEYDERMVADRYLAVLDSLRRASRTA